ncbi:3-dehydroquinate synthase [Lacibacter cauensis]|uniref:3-dehydroquinate synthase n=1 Tax=Lacibacter cauensis TaxID=510947 RepID=A0A562SSV9_9BACT|nr:3-dehydroquinate synthase [Lacibacter cauensis]TWI83870.1 3-dehydroquinate synthase [Lacibacter cauensis]
MVKQTYQFSTASVDYYFNGSMEQLSAIADSHSTVLITDENVFAAHPAKFNGWKTIVMKAGEAHKIQATVDDVIRQLIELGADRKSTLVGVGGGVVTDMVGYIAAVYMRGIACGFIPTTILAMVDASIGGKNGIDVGVYKNMVGTIRQPSFLLYDVSLLESLPLKEWENGFAEVIKHAAIKDAAMFDELEQHSIVYYQSNKEALQQLIERNCLIKTKVVQEDEFEKADRKLLNLGHTLGHAIENKYLLMHGHAVTIGMIAAAKISETINNFSSAETQRLTRLIEQYGLTSSFLFDKAEAFETLKKDKKKAQDVMQYVVLNKIGEAKVMNIPLVQLKELIENL